MTNRKKLRFRHRKAKLRSRSRAIERKIMGVINALKDEKELATRRADQAEASLCMLSRELYGKRLYAVDVEAILDRGNGAWMVVARANIAEYELAPGRILVKSPKSVREIKSTIDLDMLRLVREPIGDIIAYTARDMMAKLSDEVMRPAATVTILGDLRRLGVKL